MASPPVPETSPDRNDTFARAVFVDRVCDAFVRAWQEGKRPQIEMFVRGIPAPERGVLLLELLQEELPLRMAAGEIGSVAEYLARFPGDRETVDKAFEVAASIPHSFDDRTLDGAELQRRTRPVLDAHASPPLSVFAGYELLAEVARGGMGVVYKARQTKLRRTVALKMILAGQFASQDDVARFYAEAEAAARLDHPGIVPVYEVGEHGGQHFFSMGFVDGESLAERLRRGPLAPSEAAETLRLIVEAIAYAHAEGVIHRDLKPANVLLDGQGQPRVTDFGLAKLVDLDSGLTRTGAVMGTPAYMAPEQARGEIDRVGPLADVYSLGAMLYCMLTGRPPFQAATAVDTMLQVMNAEPVSPRLVNPEVPRDLETICLKCLEKDSSRRYESARALADELGRYLRGEPLVARPLSGPAKWWRACRRNPRTTALAGVSTLALLLLIAGGVYRQQSVQWRRSAELQSRLAAEQSTVARQQGELARRRGELADLANAMQRFSRAGELASRRAPGWSWQALEELEAARKLAGDRLDPVRVRSLATECVAALDLRLVRLIQSPRSVVDTSRFATRLAFSADGRYLAIPEYKGTPDCTVYVHAVADGSVQAAYSISTKADNAERFFGALVKGNLKPKGFQEGFWSVAFSPDDRWLAAGTRHGRLYVWDRAAPTAEPLAWTVSDGNTIGRATFGPDSRTLYAARDGDGGDLCSWNLDETWRPGRSWPGLKTEFALRPDGRQLVTSRGDVTVFDATSESRRREFPQIPSATIAYSPDGRLLVSGSRNELRLVDQETGALRQSLHATDSASVEFHADASCFIASRGLLAASASDERVRIFDLATGRQIAALGSGGRRAPPIAVSPDGRWLAIGGETAVHLYEVRAGDVTRVATRARLPVGDVALSADGRTLVYGSELAEAGRVVRDELGFLDLGDPSPGPASIVRSPLSDPELEQQPPEVRVLRLIREVLGPDDDANPATDESEIDGVWRPRYEVLARSGLSSDQLRTLIVRDHRERAAKYAIRRVAGTEVDFEADDAYLGHWRNRLAAEAESLTFQQWRARAEGNLRDDLLAKGKSVTGYLRSPFQGESGTVSIDRDGRRMAFNSGLLGLHWRSADGQVRWPVRYVRGGVTTRVIEDRDFVSAGDDRPETCEDAAAVDGRAARWVRGSSNPAGKIRVTLPAADGNDQGRTVAVRISSAADRLDPPWIRLGMSGQVDSFVRQNVAGEYEWLCVGVLPPGRTAADLEIRLAAASENVRELRVDQVAVIPCRRYRSSSDYQVFVDGPHGFSPDGSRFWGVVGGNALTGWRAEDGELVAQIETGLLTAASGDGDIRSLAIGGQVIVAGTASGCLLRIHSGEGKIERIHKATTAELTALALSADESLAAAGTIDGKVLVLRLSDMTPLGEFDAHQNRVVSVAFNEAGDQLWSASRDGLVRRWEQDAAGWGPALTLPDVGVPICAARLAPAGRRLAVLREGESVVHLWDLDALPR